MANPRQCPKCGILNTEKNLWCQSCGTSFPMKISGHSEVRPLPVTPEPPKEEPKPETESAFDRLMSMKPGPKPAISSPVGIDVDFITFDEVVEIQDGQIFQILKELPTKLELTPENHMQTSEPTKLNVNSNADALKQEAIETIQRMKQSAGEASKSLKDLRAAKDDLDDIPDHIKESIPHNLSEQTENAINILKKRIERTIEDVYDDEFECSEFSF